MKINMLSTVKGAGMACMLFVLTCMSITPAAAGWKTRPDVKGDITVFHAGSLSIPFREMARVFMARYPQIKVYLEASGSRTCARKITDLHKPCDVMASADYTVIDNLLIPDHARWNIHFATNEMALMYRPGAPYSDVIDSSNWYDILLRQDVSYGHSDPNADPCGYRTLLVWQLAERHYRKNGLYRALMDNCPARNIRPKETDLIALLESGEIDYLFIYRSVCEQHKLPYVTLPDEINLKSSEFRAFYQQASVKITGRKPGEFITKHGKPMIYGLTICSDAPNPKAAELFTAFIIGPSGQEIMRRFGQPPISPPVVTGDINALPAMLEKITLSIDQAGKTPQGGVSIQSAPSITTVTKH